MPPPPWTNTFLHSEHQCMGRFPSSDELPLPSDSLGRSPSSDELPLSLYSMPTFAGSCCAVARARAGQMLGRAHAGQTSGSSAHATAPHLWQCL